MTTLQPIEAVEQLYPVRIERTALREDSGGPGAGAAGSVSRASADPGGGLAAVGARREGGAAAASASAGGAAGATNRFWVRRNGQRAQSSPLPGKVSGFPLELGDVLLMESSGGGGFGDPLERDPERVGSRRWREGYVTSAAAEAIYGVVLREGAPDAAATAARRASLRATRLRVRVIAGAGLDAQSGREVRLSPEVATRLGVAPGAVVEFVNPRGAPLRAWVVGPVASAAGGGAVAELAPIALRMLAGTDVSCGGNSRHPYRGVVTAH